MNTQNISEAPSAVDRVVELREDLYFATDPNQDILVTTITGELIHLTDWSWTGEDLSGKLGTALPPHVFHTEAPVPAGTEVEFSLSSIKDVVNR